MKLEKRTIQPSKSAWDVLSKKMDDEENTSNNKTYWWLGIAASIIGVLLVSLFYFNRVDSEELDMELVDTPLKESKEEVSKTSNTQEVVETNIAKHKESELINKKDTQPEINQIVLSKSKLKKNVPKRTNQVASQKGYNSNTKLKKNKPSLKDNELIKETTKDLVTQNYNIETQTKLKLDLEIDRLLEQAQKDIVLKKTTRDTAMIVSSKDLLLEVELDLEESFRSKVLNTIVSGYNSIKTAVAERNE
ncbi:MAG: hypothetical protein HKO92_03140 [Flavobacteriaceae bacterium]|nr:hypothetical protein [Flavobacteriaceae bacterium]